MTIEARFAPEPPSENKIIIHNPESVIQRSLAFRVIDKKNFEQLFGKNGEKFDPRTLAENPPDVLLVEDESSTDGPGYRIMVVEGHHRLTGAVYHKRNVDSNYIVPAHNITGQYTSKEFLTPLEAFTILIDHERGHEALAPERTAARIISDWPDFVGDDIAKDFPAFAAIFKVGMARLRGQTAQALEQYLTRTDQSTPLDQNSRETKLFAAETPEKRKKVERALVGVAQVIETRNVAFSDVMVDAFAVVIEQGLVDQAQGLISFYELDAKIAKGSPDGSTLEDRKSTIALLLAQIFIDIKSRREIRALYEALVSPDLTYEQTCAILQPQEDSTIVDRLNSIKAEKARNTLATTYAEQGKEPLTEEHTWILDLLSSQTGVIPLIDRTIVLLNRAQTALEGMPDCVARKDIKEKLQSVRAARSKASLTKKLNELSIALDSKPKPREQTIYPSREARDIHHLLSEAAPLLLPSSSGPLTIEERNALNLLETLIEGRLNRRRRLS